MDTFEGKAIIHPTLSDLPGSAPHLNLPKARGQGYFGCSPWRSAPWATDQGQEGKTCSTRANRDQPVNLLHLSVFKTKARVAGVGGDHLFVNAT